MQILMNCKYRNQNINAYIYAIIPTYIYGYEMELVKDK